MSLVSLGSLPAAQAGDDDGTNDLVGTPSFVTTLQPCAMHRGLDLIPDGAIQLCATATDLVLVAVLCEHSDYGGVCAAVYDTPCLDGNGRDHEYLMPTELDNLVSSDQGHHNCWVKLYESATWGNKIHTCYNDCDYVGDDANDMASSFALY